VRGLDPTLKSARLANYLMTLRRELTYLAHACGKPHPAMVPLDQLAIMTGAGQPQSARDLHGYRPGWGEPPAGEVLALHPPRAA